MIKTLAIVVGLVFLLVGIAGFIPGLSPEHTDGNRYVLGIFEANTVHNLIHILTGLLAIGAGMASARYSRLYFQAFGVVYALVAIIGLVQGDTVLGLFDVNGADNALHVVLAVLLLAIGFGVPREADERAETRAATA